MGDRRYPFYYGAMHELRDGEYGFKLIVRNVPGVVESLSRYFANHKVNIVNLIHSNAYGEADEASIFVIGDFRDASIGPDELSDLLRDMGDPIISVESADKALGYIYTRDIFPIKLYSGRAILFGPTSQSAIINGVKESLGGSLTKTLLFQLGYRIGIRMYEYFFKPVMESREAKPLDLTDIIELLKAFYITRGWGIIVHYEVQGDKISIDFENLWECDVQKEERDPIKSNLIRGELASIFELTLKKKVRVTESRCILLGDDICRLEVDIGE
jgi:predicted hydrocarbon binding protein